MYLSIYGLTIAPRWRTCAHQAGGCATEPRREHLDRGGRADNTWTLLDSYSLGYAPAVRIREPRTIISA